VKYQTR